MAYEYMIHVFTSGGRRLQLVSPGTRTKTAPVYEKKNALLFLKTKNMLYIANSIIKLKLNCKCINENHDNFSLNISN